MRPFRVVAARNHSLVFDEPVYVELVRPTVLDELHIQTVGQRRSSPSPGQKELPHLPAIHAMQVIQSRRQLALSW